MIKEKRFKDESLITSDGQTKKPQKEAERQRDLGRENIPIREEKGYQISSITVYAQQSARYYQKERFFTDLFD